MQIEKGKVIAALGGPAAVRQMGPENRAEICIHSIRTMS